LIAQSQKEGSGGELLTERSAYRQNINGKPDGVWMDERNNAPESRQNGTAPSKNGPDTPLHPAWAAFVRYCQQMGHGEIERLKIQDGLPVLVEVSRQKIKFS